MANEAFGQERLCKKRQKRQKKQSITDEPTDRYSGLQSRVHATKKINETLSYYVQKKKIIFLIQGRLHSYLSHVGVGKGRSWGH